MSVTVADCLNLPALREATVEAGEKGLDRIVTAISVLEYVDFAVLSHDLFIGNELIITAFVCVKDDVEAQCKTIQRLSEAGEVGLILYYVGIFVPAMHENLLQMANELNFPIIRMPPDRLDFRYSDVISEVLDAIFQDQMRETYFVNSMLERISQLSEQQRTIGTVLRMLSDQLRCTLLLCTDALRPLAFTTWPMSSSLTSLAVLSAFKNNDSPSGEPFIPVQFSNVSVKMYHELFTDDHHQDMALIAIDEKGNLSQDDLKQAIELLQFFIKIWKYDFDSSHTNSLISAILNDNPAEMYRILKALNISTTGLNTMWIIRTEQEAITLSSQQIFNERVMTQVKIFLQEYGKALLVDIYENNIIVLLGNAVHEDLDRDIASLLSDRLTPMKIPFSLTICPSLRNTADTRKAYALFVECIDLALQIFPRKHPLTTLDLQFSMDCKKITDCGEEALNQYLEVLSPLAQLSDEQELSDTLLVYLLDADSNVQKTGDLMYLHKNTVKYRLSKIKQCLNYDIGKMPEYYHLYRAAALTRILQNPL